MTGHYNNLLNWMLKHPEKKLESADIYTGEERAYILDKLCKNETTETPDCTYCNLFSESVNKFADRTAVVYKDEKITYRELDRLSDALAAGLLDKSVKTEDVVGIIVDPGI